MRGTLLALTRARPELEVTWVVLAAQGERADEARASAADFLERRASSRTFVFTSSATASCRTTGGAVKEVFEEPEGRSSPISSSRTRGTTSIRITASPASSRGRPFGTT